MTRIERGQEVVERRKTLVAPVKLLVGPLQEAVASQNFPFLLACKRHMDRRGATDFAQGDQPACERCADLFAIDITTQQQPRAGSRCEGNGALQLRVIASTRALIGISPAAIEYIFALRMRLQKARHDTDDAAANFCKQVPRRPAGACGG